MKGLYFLWLILFSTYTILVVATKNPQSLTKSNYPMTAIKNWKDVAPFAGHIILYKATSCHFNKGSKSYLVSQDPSLYVGYVSPSISHHYGGSPGYDLVYLLQKGSLVSTCALITPFIADNEKGTMMMRSSTVSERKYIIKVLEKGFAQWSSTTYNNNICDVLNRPSRL